MSTRYIDWTDVANRYRDAVSKGDQVKLDDAFIRYAEAEVDARLSARYSVPFVPGSANAPLQVRDLCIDLAYYKMVWQQPFAKELRDSIDARFDRLGSGKEVLTTASGVYLEAPGEAWSSTEKYHSVFGPDDPTRWTPSSMAYIDAENSRLFG